MNILIALAFSPFIGMGSNQGNLFIDGGYAIKERKRIKGFICFGIGRRNIVSTDSGYVDSIYGRISDCYFGVEGVLGWARYGMLLVEHSETYTNVIRESGYIERTRTFFSSIGYALDIHIQQRLSNLLISQGLRLLFIEGEIQKQFGVLIRWVA